MSAAATVWLVQPVAQPRTNGNVQLIRVRVLATAAHVSRMATTLLVRVLVRAARAARVLVRTLVLAVVFRQAGTLAEQYVNNV